ncbi:MAG TPA: GAF domain-containing protein [Geobacteraceae bacterium]
MKIGKTRGHNDKAVISIGFALMIAAYLADSVIDFLYEGGSLYRQIFSPSSEEVACRFSYIGIQLIFATYALHHLIQRRRTEEELQSALAVAEDEKARSEAIIAAIGEGFCIQDREFRVLYQNPVHQRLIGGSHLGEYCYRAFGKRDTVCPDCPVEMAYRDGRVHTVERTTPLAGRMVPTEITASPLRDSSGEIVAGVKLVRDITERRRIEEEVRQATELLEERVAERTGDLARTIASLQEEIVDRQRAEAALRDSEARQRLAIESTGLGMFDYYPLTGEMIGSDMFKTHFEIPADTEWDYKFFIRGLHPDDRERVDRVLENALRPESGGECSAQFRTRGSRDGKERWIAARGRVLHDEAGQPVRFIGTTLDITAYKQAEDMIVRLNRLYSVLSGTNQVINRSSDRDTLFQDLCRVVIEHGGFRMAWIGLVDEASGMVRPVAWSGEAAGYLDDIRVSVREEPEGLGPVGTAIREGSFHICCDLMTNPRFAPWREKALRRGYRSIAAIAIKSNGTAIGALAMYAVETDFFQEQLIDLLQRMAVDISFALDNIDRNARHREAEQALREETMERLRVLETLREKDRLLLQQSRMAAMGEMISNIAHQWRQPLNSVGMIVQDLLLEYETGKFDKNYLEESVTRAMDSILHMSQTIDDFRNFFKPDKKMVRFKVRQVVVKTLSLVRESFNALGIQVDVNAQDDALINGYPNEYSQVILNILLNARDAFEERKKSQPWVITITLFTENDRAVVTIADNAGGIAEEIMGKIFEPYFTTKGPDKGTGVGLYMSSTIIRRSMHGDLTVRNIEDGAEFRIEV